MELGKLKDERDIYRKALEDILTRSLPSGHDFGDSETVKIVRAALAPAPVAANVSVHECGVPFSGYCTDGEIWDCPTCRRKWEHVCDEGEGCSWVILASERVGVE